MIYAKVTNNVAVEYSFAQLRADNRNVSFPAVLRNDTLVTYDVYPVILVAEPVVDPATTKVTGFTIEGSDSTWTQTWVTAAKTAEEQADHQTESDRVEDIALMKADAQILALLKARPTAINTYIEDNVTNLAEAKAVLKILARAVAVLAHTIVN